MSLDNLPDDLIEKVLAGNVFHDPVFDAVAAFSEMERLANHMTIDDQERTMERASLGLDSTVVNHYWEMADFYGSQFIIRKRLLDKESYHQNRAVRERRQKRASVAGCSALTGATRKRCGSVAEYVYARKTAAGNWSYQRRCRGCFEKVKDKSKYRPISDGRYF